MSVTPPGFYNSAPVTAYANSRRGKADKPDAKQSSDVQRGVAIAPQAQARLGRVATVSIQPLGIDDYRVVADLTPEGVLTRPGLSGLETLGRLDTQGNYQLQSGERGNLFENKRLTLTYNVDNNPFVMALKASERQRAVKGSEIPRIRALLTNRGITGQGVRIGILDPHMKHKGTEVWQRTPHTDAVSAMIQDPVWGVAPGARVVDLGGPDLDNPDVQTDNLSVFSNAMAQHYVSLFSGRAKQIEDLVLRRDPALRVLNMTAGTSRQVFFNYVWNTMNEKDENGYPKWPLIQAGILGNTLYGTRTQQLQATYDWLNNLLDTSPHVQQAHWRYIEATRQAAQSGLTLVGSMSNQHTTAPFGVRLRPDAEISEFAKSPWVIGVAAANTHQTPGNRSQYNVSAFSSRGDGVQWNPTIAAPGDEMGISAPAGQLGHNLVVEGTSFSTPFTCGVIAMMLQLNPTLTFDQIKTKLQTTAVKNPVYSPAEVGAGFLNAEAAVLS